jgi:hypothetical protein
LAALLKLLPIVDDAAVLVDHRQDRGALFFEGLQPGDFLLVCREERVRVYI